LAPAAAREVHADPRGAEAGAPKAAKPRKRVAKAAAAKKKPVRARAKAVRAARAPRNKFLQLVQKSLADDKGKDIAVIDLRRKSSLADYMVVASGTSSRHLATMAEHLRERLKAAGLASVPIEGLAQCDWVLIDASDVVVHLFRPEVRKFYNLEKMWSAEFHEPEPASERAAF
jgi:ribosome-associated protein